MKVFYVKKPLSIVSEYTRDDKMNENFKHFIEMSSVSAAILAHLSRIGVGLRRLVGQICDVSEVQKRTGDKHQ